MNTTRDRAALAWQATYFPKDGNLYISSSSRRGGIWNVVLSGDGKWQAYLSGRIGERYFDTPREACEYCESEELKGR